jgi:hypothetical protein
MESGSVALSLQNDAQSGGEDSVILAGDHVTLKGGGLDLAFEVPQMFADLDVAADRVAAILPPGAPCRLVIEDGAGAERLSEEFVAPASDLWTTDVPVDLEDGDSGYIDAHVEPALTVRARFAAVRLTADVAGRAISGSSTPGAWLTLTLQDQANRRQSLRYRPRTCT